MVNLAEIDDRIAKCNKLLESNPNSQIFAALADAYRRKGELDRAFRICQSGLRIHPNYGSAHMVMARINVDKEMYDWAEIEVKKVIALEGNSHTSELLLAEIYINKGDLARATKLLDELLKNDPSNSLAERLMAIAREHEAKAVMTVNEKPPVETEAVEQVATHRDIEKIDGKFLVEAISEISGVDGVLLIHKDGLVAESKWLENQNPDLYGALAREIEQTIQSQMDVSIFGKYENVLIEGANFIVNLIPLQDCLVLIKANSRINLGTFRLRISAQLNRFNESGKNVEVQK